MDAGQAKRAISRSGRIGGWLSKDAVMLFAAVDELQKRQGVSGDLFEIGVHHGKSASVLAEMARPGERLGACDLFSDQTDNVSRSGRGDRAVFEQNISAYVARGLRLDIFETNSRDLVPSEIGQNIRFFHIDGGHNAKEAQADVELAASCLAREGVIVLDDPFRANWPGVTEAIVHFLEASPDFCAFAVGFNKLFITRRPAASLYAGLQDHAFQKQYGLYRWFSKVLPFLGSPLFIFCDYQRERGEVFSRIYRALPFLHTSQLRPLVRRARRFVRGDMYSV
jgi:hypothetical protein